MQDKDNLQHIKIDFPIPDSVNQSDIAGPSDENLKLLQASFDVLVSPSAKGVVIEGNYDRANVVAHILEDMVDLLNSGEIVDDFSVRNLISQRQRIEFSPVAISSKVIIEYKGHSIRAKTPGQACYIDAITNNVITFGVGPAGSGKTYLAMAMAISALKRRSVGRIILSRPILEAGESLGYLPGTLNEKVDPYIRPLYDALFDMLDSREATMLLHDETIEIAPLAFMRGRTLNDSFIILDEAQNTTCEQMKMFLTRLGFGSKMVITGDLSQSDLPRKVNGLAQSLSVLDNVDNIAICRLNKGDVVRNPLVGAIISAYEDAGL